MQDSLELEDALKYDGDSASNSDSEEEDNYVPEGEVAEEDKKFHVGPLEKIKGNDGTKKAKDVREMSVQALSSFLSKSVDPSIVMAKLELQGKSEDIMSTLRMLKALEEDSRAESNLRQVAKSLRTSFASILKTTLMEFVRFFSLFFFLAILVDIERVLFLSLQGGETDNSENNRVALEDTLRQYPEITLPRNNIGEVASFLVGQTGD
jgi:hypothetical protein